MTKPDPTVEDDTPVWHLIAEVLPGNQAATVCGRVVGRDATGPSAAGRCCLQCEPGDQ